MILTEDDLPIYAPSITLTGDALEGALTWIQALIESPFGANRKLEKTLITEVLRVNELQAVFLSYQPVLEDPPVEVEVRQGGFRDWGGVAYPPGEWKTLEDFTIDENELTLTTGPNVREFWGCTWHYGYGLGYRNPRHAEAKVKYWTGFDFTEDNWDTRYIKAHTGKILEYTQSPNYQGVKSLQVPFREFSISFGESAGPGTVPDILLAPFKIYTPITYC